MSSDKNQTEVAAAAAGVRQPPLSPIKAILFSHVCRFGYLEGGPEDGTTFLRSWDSNSIATKGGLYRINRERVEDQGRGHCVIYEFAGETEKAV